jgi:hypothetical protein
MSTLPTDPVMTERAAAERLSELLLREGIGPQCLPEVIMRLFKNHWGKLSVLGHSLHNAQERRRAPLQEPQQNWTEEGMVT